MFTDYRVGQKVRLMKLVGSDEDKGYKVGDIITIGRTVAYKNGIDDSKGYYFRFDQLAPVFEIGDEVEIITHPFIKDIKEGKITHIGWVGLYGTDTSIWINGMEKTVKGGHWLGENQVKLIRKGEGMARFKVGDRVKLVKGGRIDWESQNWWEHDNLKLGNLYVIRFVDSYGDVVLEGGRLNHHRNHFELYTANSLSLRDRIEALTGWDKEADDIAREIYKKISINSTDSISLAIYARYINIPIDSNNEIEIEDVNHKVYKKFTYTDQCSKLRAFKDALLFLLDKSGLEKDSEKEELLKQIAELRTHHEQEGQRIEELERRIK